MTIQQVLVAAGYEVPSDPMRLCAVMGVMGGGVSQPWDGTVRFHRYSQTAASIAAAFEAAGIGYTAFRWSDMRR